MRESRNAKQLAERKPDDAERIALTLIEKHIEDGIPTFADNWLRSVLNDTTFVQHSTLEEQVKGFESYLEERDDANFPSEWEQHLYAQRATHSLEAVIALADAVVTHRLYGEPNADTTIPLGFGLNVTTSLAAAIVDYTRGMIRIMGRR